MTKFFTIILFALILALSCKKENTEKSSVLKQLYSQYKDGEIDQATYKGETVYVTGINAYDSSTSIYDKNGNVIGGCDYSYGLIDPICYDLGELKAIYRCENHLSGKPPVDLFKLRSNY
jgi:hypothetical protein